ncbi:MAG: UDP-N-acetylmuramoyl-tripeptide--D-alanyl-D-alanine ligase [Pseudomonadota bacterium]
MTPLWTAAEAAEATEGATTGDWSTSGLSIDTRSILPGEMFVALTDRRDGHDFVADALAKGASAALVSRVPEDVAKDAPLLLVPDVLEALRAMAKHRRATSQAKIAAITGSVGKTSTKEMLRAALAREGNVHAAEMSFNNHWGVPLTLARCPKEADFAVIEIGMNHPGEIAPLAELAAPDVAVITTVAAAHVEAFPDGLPGIAREKSAIYAGLKPDGAAIYNADLDTTPILAGAAALHGWPIAFGMDAESPYRLLSTELARDKTEIAAELRGDPIRFALDTLGRHFAMNALAVIAAADALGADRERVLAGLEEWRPPPGRGTREEIPLPQGSFELYDDAYNANPTSLGAALEVLAAAEPGPGGKRIAILGDMLELGPEEIALHAGVATHPSLVSADKVHCSGPRMSALWSVLPPDRQGLRADQAAELAAQVADLVQPNDIVLVKGSKGSLVSVVVDALRQLGQADPEAVRGTS